MQKILALLSCVLVVLLFGSCGVPKNFQHAIYLQDSITDSERMVMVKPAIIMPGDRLSIGITAINQEAAQAFNIPTGAAGAAASATGYLVDSAGNIQLLQLGQVHVAGLTPAQLQQNLQQQLVNYIKGPLVTVTIANFTINVMGEVGKPGPIIVPDGKINILQALNQSGDLTLFAKRDNILVIREVNGIREFGRVDISSNKIFSSPYYNLQQNDVIYVEPDKTKFIANDAIASRNVRNLSIVLTLLTAFVLVENLIN